MMLDADGVEVSASQGIVRSGQAGLLSEWPRIAIGHSTFWFRHPGNIGIGFEQSFGRNSCTEVILVNPMIGRAEKLCLCSEVDQSFFRDAERSGRHVERRRDPFWPRWRSATA